MSPKPAPAVHWATYDSTGIAHAYHGLRGLETALCDPAMRKREERYERAIRAKCVRCLTVEKYGPKPA